MIVHGLQILRHYLVGRNFELKIDHHGLQLIFMQFNLNTRQSRCSKLLSEYDFDVSYIKGTLNRVIDALSCKPHIFSIFPLKMNLRKKKYIKFTIGR